MVIHQNSVYLIDDHINKWIIFCFTILSFQIHAVEDTCQLWNSSQAIDLNNNISFHLYNQEHHYRIRYDTRISKKLYQDLLLEYPEIILAIDSQLVLTLASHIFQLG